MSRFLTIEEAAAISGFAPYTLRMFARNNEFSATKPRGDRGGWEIEERSFYSFIKRRRIQGANQFMKDLLKRGRL